MKIIVSGGGTAGHIYPALAVAEELREQGHEILFVGAEGRMEMERVPKAGFRIVGLPIVGINRSFSVRSVATNMAFPFKLYRSMQKARAIIDRECPDVVVGFGGYASAPIVKAAQKCSIPTVLQEQNSFAGLTNRMLAKKAYRVCTAYHGMEQFFPSDKIVITGNPLRGAIALLPPKEEALAYFGLSANKRTVLITGGSGGARTLNEIAFAASLPTEVQIIWQTGRFYEKEFNMRVEQTDKDVSSYHIVPFIERMDMAYAAADVVICRSGASTISELSLIGLPAVFIPSPNVAGDHQTANARALVDMQAAVMISDALAIEQAIPTALEIIADEIKAKQMAQKMRSLGKPYATRDVARIIVESATNGTNH